MNSLDCQWLDDYLAGELPCDWEPLFADHLSHCAACRREVDEWRALQAMLRRASDELETPPATLVQSLSTTIGNPPRPSSEPPRARRLAVAAGICLAVALCVAMLSPPSDVNEVQKTVTTNPPPEVRIKLPDNVIGVPVDIGDPDVTVVWVYPVYEPPEAD